MVGLKAVGLKAIVAVSFARIFYRSAINQGLLLIECPEAVKAYYEGAKIEIDAGAGKVSIDGKAYSFPKLPKEIIQIVEASGLLEYTRKKLEKK